MKNTDSLQKAVVEAVAEFSAAREKLIKAELAYNQALDENASTFNAVDKSKQQKFSSNAPAVTDC